MKDLLEENKVNVENALLQIQHNRLINAGGSSSSLDSKDSKTSKNSSGLPSQIDATEKKWFSNSAKCNLVELKILFEKKCELLNKKDYFTGFAAIHWASKKGRYDILSWLFEQKADMNLRTNGGYTPLIIATIHNKELIIQKLINNFNADINIRDYSGRKARHYMSADLPPAVNKALQETPSVTDMQVDPYSQIISTNGFSTPTAIRRSLRKPMLKTMSIDRSGIEEESAFRRKKKGISISNSFKTKKKSAVVRREPTTSGDQSPPFGSHRWDRSPSVPDIIHFSKLNNERRPSLFEYSTFSPSAQLVDDYFPEKIPTGRKVSVSDILVNGYAGLINENKRHRKQSIAENKDWGINTWI